MPTTKKKTRKVLRGPRGGIPRTDASGNRHQLNLYMHTKLIDLMDEARCHVSRRAWLETVLCSHFGISEREIA